MNALLSKLQRLLRPYTPLLLECHSWQSFSAFSCDESNSRCCQCLHGGEVMTSCLVQPDVDEALRLMRMSKMSLFEDQNSSAAQDPITAIYTSIRDNAVLTGKRTFLWSEMTALLGRTYTVPPPFLPPVVPCLSLFFGTWRRYEFHA